MINPDKILVKDVMFAVERMNNAKSNLAKLHLELSSQTKETDLTKCCALLIATKDSICRVSNFLDRLTILDVRV